MAASGVGLNDLSGRSFRNKSSEHMAFPHPQSRQQHDGKEYQPGCGGVIRKDFKRTIDIADDWNAADDVNPANNRTFGGISHDRSVLHFCRRSRDHSLPPGFELLPLLLMVALHHLL